MKIYITAAASDATQLHIMLQYTDIMEKCTLNFSEAKSRATVLVRDCGAGATTPTRVAVLAILLRSEQPLNHVEIQSRLQKQQAVNRVTVYRVLEWLVQRGLAHKILNEQGVGHFAASTERTQHAHAHFHCERCGQFYCLPDMPSAAAGLPTGFIARDAELTVHGFCVECSR